MGPKKAKSKMPVDGVDTTSMSREQLEAFCIRLREELDREREERNFFQLERDKLRTYWEITRQQLEESRAQQRNQDRAIDELEEKHQEQIKVYKQKVKHLLYEHESNLSELQVESMVSLKQAQDDYNAMEQQLLKDKKELKEQNHDMELKHLEEIRQLKIEHSSEVSRIREQLESDAAELEKKYEARLTNQAEEQSMREKMEQAEVETRKNQHIVDLTKQHEAAFQKMKNYYNDITLNNLALISTLKEQIEELKANHDRMEKQLNACQAENKKLAEPLKQAQSELGLLRRQLTTYEQDKVTLANTKQRLSLITKELEDLRWENDVLELRFEKVEKERDRLHAEFVGAVLDVQQKTGLKGALLEKRMASMRSGVSQKTGVSVSDCSTQLNIAQKTSPRKNTRPATAPLRLVSSDTLDEEFSRRDSSCSNRSLSRRFMRPQTKCFDDDIAPKRFESRGIKGKGRLRRPHISEHCKSRWMRAVMRTHRTANTSENECSQVLCQSRGTRRVSEYEPQTKDSWWSTPALPSEDKNTLPVPLTCICGQHANGCRINAYDRARPSVESLNFTFDYLARNCTKRRYYPQILDSVRRSLSPIHSQEHPSDVSIHDGCGSDQAAVSHQIPFPPEDRRPDTPSKDPSASPKIRPLSASRSDGRDSVFIKAKSFTEPSVSRSKTATSLVFSKFYPLPPRPADLPWLHNIKSRYFSVHTPHKRKECVCCRERPATVDAGVQTIDNSQRFSFSSGSKRYYFERNGPAEAKLDSDDTTQSYFSQILNNPFQLSYSVSHFDRSYAAVITSPKSENPRVADALSRSVGSKWAEDAASNGPVPLQSWGMKVGCESAPNWRNDLRTDVNLSFSSFRHIDIEGDDNSIDVDPSSPAVDTPVNASQEDTGLGVSSLSAPSQLDDKECTENSRSLELENSIASMKQFWSSTRENSVERKHDRTPLKRKLKATILRRLKLKLMICSYMHRQEEGDVNFVHPSARKILVGQTPLDPFQDSYDPGKLENVGNDVKGVLVETPEEKTVSVTSSAAQEQGKTDQDIAPCNRHQNPLCHYCCVCQNEMTSFWESTEDDQICCDACQEKADALLGEYERSQTGVASKELDDTLNDVFSKARIFDESLQKEFDDGSINPDVHYAFSGAKVFGESDDLSLDKGTDVFRRPWRGCSDDLSSSAGAECIFSGGRLVGDKLTADATKQGDDCCKTVFENPVSEAGLVTEPGEVSVTKTKLDDVQKLPSKEKSREEDTGQVLFTLSRVQTAIRSAMKMIYPMTSSGRSSPTQTPPVSIKSPGTPDNCSRPLTPTIKSPIKSISVCALSRCSSASSKSSQPDKAPTPPNKSDSNLPVKPLDAASIDVTIPRVDLKTKEMKEKSSAPLTATKPFHVYPLAVPRGTLKGNTRKLVYTEFPVRTYDFPANRMTCLSKPKNMLVFYEVSKIRNKTDHVTRKIPSVDSETGVTLPRVSLVETRPPPSQFLLRPSRSSLLVSDGIPIAGIRTVDNVHQPDVKEHLKSDVAANLPCRGHDRKRASSTKFSDGKFDLLLRRRRESWIFSENSSSSKGAAESGKFRRPGEKQANEDDVRLPRRKEEWINANRDKGCQCLKRGRKCNCSLTNHLHIRSLNLPRQPSVVSLSPKNSDQLFPFREVGLLMPGKKYEDLNDRSKVFPDGVDCVGRYSSVRSVNFGPLRRSRRFEKGESRLDSMPEEPVSLDSCLQDSGNASRVLEVREPPARQEDHTVPSPPPPSPITFPCSPTSPGRRNLLSRRQTGKVSFRDTEDQTNKTWFLPPLPQKRQS